MRMPLTIMPHVCYSEFYYVITKIHPHNVSHNMPTMYNIFYTKGLFHILEKGYFTIFLYLIKLYVEIIKLN